MRLSVKYLEALGLDQNPIVLDIGANDGSWLSLFGNPGERTFGVEPSPAHWEELHSRGHEFHRGYFDDNSLSRIKEWLGGRRLDLISINNTISNMPNVRETFRLLNELSTENTIVSIITGYHFDQFNSLMLDYVYHEHLSYFSVTDLVRLAREFGFSSFAVRRFPLKGGSVQFICRKEVKNHLEGEEVMRLVDWEQMVRGSNVQYRDMLNSKLEILKARMFKTLEDLKSTSKRVVGYGYSHSVSSLLRLTEIEGSVARIVDDNPSRQGFYTPGKGWKIESPRTLNPQNDCVIILAWQHSRLIVQRIKELSPEIKFSTPDGSISNLPR
jgi:hypothetical protein